MLSYKELCLQVPPNSLSIPACNFRLYYWRYVDALGYTPLTLSCEFHYSGLLIAVSGVVESFPLLNPTNMGGI